jgi:hypothetical protein
LGHNTSDIILSSEVQGVHRQAERQSKNAQATGTCVRGVDRFTDNGVTTPSPSYCTGRMRSCRKIIWGLISFARRGWEHPSDRHFPSHHTEFLLRLRLDRVAIATEGKLVGKSISVVL